MSKESVTSEEPTREDPWYQMRERWRRGLLLWKSQESPERFMLENMLLREILLTNAPNGAGLS